MSYNAYIIRCRTDIRQQQAFRPVKRENLYFVEQAGKPVHKRLIDKGATYELQRLYNPLPNRHPLPPLQNLLPNFLCYFP